MGIASIAARQQSLEVALDNRSPVPLYLQLKHHVVHLISSGRWQPGMALPSVRQAALDLGLATATVQRAYGELQAEGFVVGQTGRGVYVAELTAGRPRLAAEGSQVLRGLLAQAISQAQGLGFPDEAILATVRELLNSRAGAGPEVRMVFVGRRPEFAEKYGLLLREALADLRVSVETVLEDDLEEDADAVLDHLEPVHLLVSLVGGLSDLRRLAGHRGIPLYGLVVDLTEDAERALMELSFDTPVGLVAEKQYMQSARALIQQYRGSQEGLRAASESHRAAVLRVLRECEVVFHTLGTKRLLERLAPPGVRLVELRYRPNPASVARLRSLLAAERPAVAARIA